MKAFLSKGFILFVFLLFPFFFSHVEAATPCTNIAISPDLSKGPYLANQTFTISGSGCTSEIGSTLQVIYGPAGDFTTGGVTTPYISADGTFQMVIGDIVPATTFTFPVTYEITVMNIYNVDLQPMGPYSVSFSGRVNPRCNDIVSPENYSKCPTDCPARHPADNENIYQCLPVPTLIPTETPLTCSLTANVFTDNNTFRLAVSMNQSGLTPGGYRLVLNDGLLHPKQNFLVTPGQVSQELAFNGLDSGYNGKTIELFVEQDCGPLVPAGGCSHIDNCTTQVTFDATAIPTYGPGATLFPSIPANPTPVVNGKNFTVTPCDSTGNRDKDSNQHDGIQTAFGCIPTDPGGFFRVILGLAIGVAGGIAFLLVLFGGVKIIGSGGNPEAMNEGKEIVTSAIVGLLLIIFSVFLLKFIGINLFCIPGFGGTVCT